MNKGSGRCFCFRQLVGRLRFFLEIVVPEGSKWLTAEPEGSEWLTVEGSIWLAEAPEGCECLCEWPEVSLWVLGGRDVSG